MDTKCTMDNNVKTQKCNKCNNDKPLKDFVGQRPGTVTVTCAHCREIWNRSYANCQIEPQKEPRQKMRLSLPDPSTGITADQMPPYVCYSKARGSHGDYFYISKLHPDNKTGSNIMSNGNKRVPTIDKFKEILEKLEKLTNK